MSDGERAALEALEEQERAFRRGAVIRREHDPARELFIVQKGWLHSCVILHSGSRQILRLHFPGDLIGASVVPFGCAGESVVAVTDVVLCPFGKDRLARLFVEQPRLAALIFMLAVAERASLADRLASIGRTSARARVAALLCEIFARYRIVEGREQDMLQLPLTQEDIGDLTGLTAVHVNRMMRGLVEDGLIDRSGSQVRLLDKGRLAREANFTDRHAGLDTAWLPPSR